MEVKKTRKIGGFLSIELMLVLSVMALLGAASLYVAQRCIDRTRMFALEIEIARWEEIIADYHVETGEWPFATNVWVNLREVGASLKYLIDQAFPGNTYFTREERKSGFPDIWTYIDASHGRRNLFGEEFLTELQKRTERETVGRDEIKGGYGSVYFFLPKEGDPNGSNRKPSTSCKRNMSKTGHPRR